MYERVAGSSRGRPQEREDDKKEKYTRERLRFLKVEEDRDHDQVE